MPGIFIWILTMMAWAGDAQIQVFFRSDSGVRPVKTYLKKDVQGIDQTQVSKSLGPRMDQVVADALKDFSPSDKGRVDLLVLRGSGGESIQIPRSFTVKYPLRVLVGPNGSFETTLVVGEALRPKMEQERLPHERYALKGLKEIWLVNYNDYYSSFRLKNRSDPLALRGEKIWTQSCMFCHSGSEKWKIDAGGVSNVDSKLKKTAHPTVSGYPKFNERDLRALDSFFQAIK